MCFACHCRHLYNWSMVLRKDVTMKRVVDGVIAVICHIDIAYFQTLLQKFFVSVLPTSNQTEILTASVSDDAKDDIQHGKSTNVMF